MSDSAVKVDPVTKRWADALYELARDAGAEPSVQEGLDKLAAEFSVPAVRDWFVGGKHTPATKVQKLGPVLAGAHALVQRFVALSFERRRDEVLVGAAEAFRRRTLEAAGIVEGVVEAARELDGATLHELESGLGQRLGKTVRLSQRPNPELVGGVRVFVGAHLIDASVQGRMESLRRRMLEAPLTSARNS